MGSDVTDVLGGIAAVLNNRDRTSQCKLELVAPEFQETHGPAELRQRKKGSERGRDWSLWVTCSGSLREVVLMVGHLSSLGLQY